MTGKRRQQRDGSAHFAVGNAAREPFIARMIPSAAADFRRVRGDCRRPETASFQIDPDLGDPAGMSFEPLPAHFQNG
jgi:hypothetical protein